jgi:hypothetical protein
MRWWKRFREDLDRPYFQAGIEKFGTGFAHDVDRVWQLLCVEDGPGIRKLQLTPEMLAVFARLFRVTEEETSDRLAFMASVGLMEIRESSGEKFITSSELKRRRDEWSRRKARDNKQKDGGKTQESQRSHSRETPEQIQIQKQMQTEKATASDSESDSDSDSDFTDKSKSAFEDFDCPPGKKLRLQENLLLSLFIDPERLNDREEKALKKLQPIWARSFKQMAETMDVVEWLDESMRRLNKGRLFYPEILKRRTEELRDGRLSVEMSSRVIT